MVILPVVSPLPSLHYIQGSTLLLTSRVRFPVVVFGLNHIYQSSLYRLNPNPPPTITLLYHAIVSSLPSRHSGRRFRPPSAHHPRRAIPALFLH
jgi:hypothetical protein